jgi:hypothetical protein
VASCDVLIALIGRQWLTSTDAAGQRRLDNPEDFVRQEIAMALRRNIRVIPALIQDTPMPRTTDLPEDLKTLTRRNALEISDTHFHHDVYQLIVVLDRVLRPATAGTPQTETRGPAPPDRAVRRATLQYHTRVQGWQQRQSSPTLRAEVQHSYPGESHS